MSNDIIPRLKIKVRSDETPDVFYMVDMFDNQWECTCPARQTRGSGYFCKHILRCEKLVNGYLGEKAKDTAPKKLRQAARAHGTEEKPLVVADTYDFGPKLVFPRVTSIISECKNPNSLIKWAGRTAATALKTDPMLSIEEAELAPFHFRSAKAKIGTNVHTFVELYNSGKKAEQHIKDMPVAEQPYAEAFMNWLDTFGRENITTLDQERAVFSRKHKYAGKFDWLVALNMTTKKAGVQNWLLDIKTSKWVFEEFGLQLRAYKEAILEMKLIDIIHGMAIIHLKPDGTFAFIEVDEPLEPFLAMREVWAWRNARKTGEVV